MLYLYEYDNAGRLLNIKLSQNADGADAKIMNAITYNELGQTIQKKIHQSDEVLDDYLQSVNYEYNIKGTLTKINNPE